MLLGFIVSKRDIEANPEKIAAITPHPEPLLETPSQGEVYSNAWNIQKLRRFYP
jgi:hypothetical protein